MPRFNLTQELRRDLIQSIIDLDLQLDEINETLTKAETAKKRKPKVKKSRSDAVTAALLMGHLRKGAPV